MLSYINERTNSGLPLPVTLAPGHALCTMALVEGRAPRKPVTPNNCHILLRSVIGRMAVPSPKHWGWVDGHKTEKTLPCLPTTGVCAAARPRQLGLLEGLPAHFLCLALISWRADGLTPACSPIQPDKNKSKATLACLLLLRLCVTLF